MDTGDHPPVSVPPYRFTPAKKEIIKAELDRMLQEGIIEETESAWTTPAVLVPKKNNQGEKNEERPIEYASRLLPAERHYSTTEREALAVVWAVEKFRSYIHGHHIIVRSDHQPLKCLLTLKSPSGRLIRWALKLQSFDITYEYITGYT